MKSTPILLLHYGDAFYMQSIIKASIAKGNQVFLLGDKSNEYLGEIAGCVHREFDAYLSIGDKERFDAAFQFVHGAKFVGKENWVRFNFLKMIAVFNFANQEKLKQFWLLDSDVLVTRNLTLVANSFPDIDLMTHPRNLSPQGLINSPHVFKDFFDFVISKFSDSLFIQKAREDFVKNPDYGLTYMRFWNAFYEERDYRYLEMGSFGQEFHFVPCLFNQPKYKKYPFTFQNFQMSEVYFGKVDQVCMKSEDDEWVQPVTINLSWLPPHIHFRILNHGKGVSRILYKLEKLIKGQEKVRMHLAQTTLERFGLKFKKKN